MQGTIHLSENAVAVLRFRGKGRKVPLSERNLPAFHELVAAGLMEAEGEDFRLTEAGRTEWEDIVDRESDRIEHERYPIPDEVVLSEAAKVLLRRCVTDGIPEGDQANRPAFRELVKVNLLMPLGSFSRGDECLFRFTYLGRERALEILGGAKPTPPRNS